MTEVLVERNQFGFKADSEEAYKVFGGIAVGTRLVIDVKDPRRRSTAQHRFWFVMANELFANQETYKTFDSFRKALLVIMGWRHEYHLPDGTLYLEPNSLKFGSMEQQTFTQLVDNTLDFAESIGFDRGELLRFTRDRAGEVY